MGTLLEVDYRERTSALFPMVAACSDFDVRVDRLIAGDYTSVAKSSSNGKQQQTSSHQ